MSRGHSQGGIKNYEFNKLNCPECSRIIAVSYGDSGWISWRTHKPCGRPRRDRRQFELAEYEKKREAANDRS